jgi:hypothetical protein
LIRAPENKPWCFGGTSGNKNIRHVVYAQATFDQDVIDAANKSSEGTSSTQTNKQYLSYDALLGRQFLQHLFGNALQMSGFFLN